MVHVLNLTHGYRNFHEGKIVGRHWPRRTRMTHSWKLDGRNVNRRHFGAGYSNGRESRLVALLVVLGHVCDGIRST